MKINFTLPLALMLILNLLLPTKDNHAQALQSITDSVIATSTGSVYDWGRGFRFQTKKDVWIYKIGKRVPVANGGSTGNNYDWVIWDDATQTKIHVQTSASSNPGNWIYEDMSSVLKLDSGKVYILELYGRGNATYYYIGNNQIDVNYFTYIDMSFCNSCDSSVYPNSRLTPYHYGTPDFLFSLNPPICGGQPTAGTAVASPMSPNCNTPTSLSLSGNSGGQGLSYQWQYNEGNGWVNFGSDTNQLMSPPINGSTQVRSIVTCTNTPGGVDTSAPVTITPAGLDISLGNDTFVCSNEVPLTLNVSFSGTPSSYLWNDHSIGTSLQVYQSGDYYVKVTNSFGCSGTDTVHVDVLDLPNKVLNDSMGLCDGTSAILDALNPGLNYLWNTNETTQTITVDSPGLYTVQITDHYGCSTMDSTFVIHRPLPEINLGGDTVVCGRTSILLDVQDPRLTDYLWSTHQTSPQIYTTDSGYYWVEVTDEYGCKNKDSLHLSFIGSPISEGFNFIPDFGTTLGLVHFRILNPKDVQMAVWDYGDESPKDTAISPSHVFPVGQHVYGVTLNLYNNCDSFSTSLPIEINTTTGIAEVKQNSDLILYPNPTKGQLNIKSHEAIHQITVYDGKGRKVMQKAFSNNAQQVLLETGRLSAGWYFMSVTGEKGVQIKQFSKK